MSAFQTENQDDIKKLFIHQLNRINCTKGYLTRNLPQLAEMASFKNLQLAIMECHDDVQRQQSRVDDIYRMLGTQASDQGCEVVKAIIEEAYKLGNKDGKTRAINDMDIILYMRLIENIELTSFRMLKQINHFIGNEQITQLLLECCDENADNDHLFNVISEEYIDERITQ